MVRIVNLRVIMLLGRGTKGNAGINLLKHINEEPVKQSPSHYPGDRMVEVETYRGSWS